MIRSSRAEVRQIPGLVELSAEMNENKSVQQLPMAKKNKFKAKKADERVRRDPEAERIARLHPDTRRSIWAIVLVGVAVLLFLAGFAKAGPAGQYIFEGLTYLLGWGYFVLPLALLVVAGVFFVCERQKIGGGPLLGGGVLVLYVLGLIELA